MRLPPKIAANDVAQLYSQKMEAAIARYGEKQFIFQREVDIYVYLCRECAGLSECVIHFDSKHVKYDDLLPVLKREVKSAAEFLYGIASKYSNPPWWLRKLNEHYLRREWVAMSSEEDVHVLVPCGQDAEVDRCSGTLNTELEEQISLFLEALPLDNDRMVLDFLCSDGPTLRLYRQKCHIVLVAEPRVGDEVLIYGLNDRTELNGSEGVVIDHATNGTLLVNFPKKIGSYFNF